jgi:hypothetical protein
MTAAPAPAQVELAMARFAALFGLAAGEEGAGVGAPRPASAFASLQG